MEKFLIKAGTLIDGVSEAPRHNVGILVAGGEILAVKPVNAFSEQELGNREGPAHIYDYSDKTVMPGMINCHVHVHFNPVLNTKQSEEQNEVEIIVEAYKNLQKYLDTGVTYIRNQGSPDFIDLKLKRMIDAGKITGPGICASGPNICMTGGHGHRSGIEADGPDECRKAARYVIKNGVQTVKLMVTGGVMTEGVEPGSPQLTYEELKAAVDEAKKAGRMTSAHAQGAEGILNTVKAGMTSVEHGIYLTDEIIDLMLENGTYLVPTLAAPFFILEKGVEGGVDEFAVKKTKIIEKHHVNSFKKAYKRGVKIAMGTDAGTPFNLHERSWYEFKLMTDYGMDAMDALKCGTINAAEMLQISDDYGSIEAGKKADIIILPKNPLEDIEALKEVEAVFKLGNKVK